MCGQQPPFVELGGRHEPISGRVVVQVYSLGTPHSLTPLEHGTRLTRLTRAIGSPSLFRKSGSPTSALVPDHCDTLNRLGFLAASRVAVDVGGHSDAHQCLHVQDTEDWVLLRAGDPDALLECIDQVEQLVALPDAAPLALVEPLPGSQGFHPDRLSSLSVRGRRMRKASESLGATVRDTVDGVAADRRAGAPRVWRPTGLERGDYGVAQSGLFVDEEESPGGRTDTGVAVDPARVRRSRTPSLSPGRPGVLRRRAPLGTGYVEFHITGSQGGRAPRGARPTRVRPA